MDKNLQFCPLQAVKISPYNFNVYFTRTEFQESSDCLIIQGLCKTLGQNYESCLKYINMHIVRIANTSNKKVALEMQPHCKLHLSCVYLS